MLIFLRVLAYVLAHVLAHVLVFVLVSQFVVFFVLFFPCILFSGARVSVLFILVTVSLSCES